MGSGSLFAHQNLSLRDHFRQLLLIDLEINSPRLGFSPNLLQVRTLIPDFDLWTLLQVEVDVLQVKFYLVWRLFAEDDAELGEVLQLGLHQVLLDGESVGKFLYVECLEV